MTFGLPRRDDREWRDDDGVVPPELRAQEAKKTPAASDEKRAPEERKGGSTEEGTGFMVTPDRQATAGVFHPSSGGKYDERGGVAGGKNSPYYLFRFFDHHVQPGKRYRYRVRVAVANPNFDVSPDDVNKEVRERMNNKETWQRYLISPWSQLSDVVAIPRDDRLLAVSVKPSARNDGEPTAKIMAVHWDMQEGKEIAAEFDIQLGKLANFQGEKPAGGGAPAPVVMGGGKKEEEGGGLLEAKGKDEGKGPKPKAPKPKPAANVPKVDYRTDMLVLDIDGGAPLLGKNSDLAWPGKILLLTPDGGLEIRADVTDQKACKAVKSPPTRDASRSPEREKRERKQGWSRGRWRALRRCFENSDV